MSEVASEEQSVELTVEGKPLRIHCALRVTPAGLMAIAALVSTILLSTSAVVWAAGTVHKKTHLPFT